MGHNDGTLSIESQRQYGSLFHYAILPLRKYARTSIWREMGCNINIRSKILFHLVFGHSLPKFGSFKFPHLRFSCSRYPVVYVLVRRFANPLPPLFVSGSQIMVIHLGLSHCSSVIPSLGVPDGYSHKLSRRFSKSISNRLSSLPWPTGLTR